MRFGPRNAYYLRISEHTVIPLYLYLDERHIDWMSERVLQHVLEDLRPKILPKLKEEANARLGPGGPANVKKGTVDVHRGDTYQFGYFLSETKAHSVLIKTRNFVPAPAPQPGVLPPPRSASPEQPARKGRRRARAPKKTPSQKGKRSTAKGKQRARKPDDQQAIAISSDEDDDVEPEPPVDVVPRRSTRVRRVVASGYRDQYEEEDQEENIAPEVCDVDVDTDMAPPSNEPAMGSGTESATPAPDQLDDRDLIAMDESEDIQQPRETVKREDIDPPIPPFDEPTEDIIAKEITVAHADANIEAPLPQDEERDDKQKLALRLQYQGFNIQGRHLCVVVEPYPPIRGPPRAPSLAPIFNSAPRAPSIAPPDFIASGSGCATRRAQTPLFLPEDDGERGVTPTPSVQRQRTLPPVPLFNDNPEDSDSDGGGFMEFSQILRSVGQHPAGIAEDDDEIEGAVFFGDADETKEL